MQTETNTLQSSLLRIKHIGLAESVQFLVRHDVFFIPGLRIQIRILSNYKFLYYRNFPVVFINKNYRTVQYIYYNDFYVERKGSK